MPFTQSTLQLQLLDDFFTEFKHSECISISLKHFTKGIGQNYHTSVIMGGANNTYNYISSE